MSGGIAYIYDKSKEFRNGLCNMEMVELEELTSQDKKELNELINNHKDYTKSSLAEKLLNNWNVEINHFIKVFPVDYKKALARLAKEGHQVEQLTA